MVKYVDKNVWVEEVLMPDESTPILGGAPDWDEDNMLAGWSNVPAGQLADRTRFLKDKVEELEQEIETGGSNALQKDNNLSDLQDVGQAKFNLGLNLVDNTRDLDKPVSDLTQEALDEKVDKEAGKGLSSNDFTTAEKNKLSGIQAGAQVNVATNLGVGTRTTTSVPVTSSTGSAATLPAATTTLAGVMSAADKTKLLGIEAGATANATNAQLRDRATHTGEQAISTITGLQTALDGKAANSVNINAGSGLTGGGNLTTSRTLTLGTPSTITASTTNSVSSTSHTHEITLTKADIGLGNVDNTSDTNKPVSTATQNALNSKVDKVSGYGLSQENFTPAEKTKLAGLESSRWKGQFVSEAALNAAFPTAEPGSYADVDSGAGQDVARYIWDSNDSKWVKQSGVVAPLTSAQVKQLYEANPDTNAFTNTEKSKLAGIANNANNYVHPNSGVSAGTYKSVTVNAQGHVTGGSNPSTLSGYGITDAAPLSHVGSAGSAHGVATPSVAGFMSAADKAKLDGISDGAGVPSVTSVAGKQGAVILVKGDVGLGNVDNTSDASKPVSTATQNALDTKVDKVAGKQLSTEDFTSAEKTKLSGIQAGAQVNTVTSVAGKTGAVALTKADVALGNVDNTADSVKNVASAAKLTTARTISATGDANWAVTFDGSGNSTAALTLTNTGVTAGTYPKVTVDTKGRVTGGASLAASDIPSLPTSKITGLGTAATKNVGTSTGNVMEVGAFGLGGGIYTVDPDTNTSSGLFTIGSNSKTVPGGTIPGWSTYLNLMRSTHGEQLFVRNDTLQFRSKGSGGVSSPWGDLHSVWHDGNFNPNSKANTASPVFTGVITGNGSGLTDLNASSLTGTASVSTTGNAATSTKLATARTLTVGSTGKAFDGSANLSWTLAEIGAAAANHTHNYLPLSGGTLTGALTLPSVGTSWITGTGGTGSSILFPTATPSQWHAWQSQKTANGNAFAIGVLGDAFYVSYATKANIDAGNNSTTQLLTANSSGISIAGTLSAAGGFTGNAASATTLATGRTIGMTGDVTWTSASFNGSGNVTGVATLANSGVTAGTYTKVTVDAKGRVTSGSGMAASDVPALNASKAQVLNGTNNSYVSGSTYLNVISWNNIGSLSANTSINLDTSLNHSLTAAASLTLDATNVDPGKTGDIVINTPNAVTVSWAAKWKFLGSVPNIGGAGETWVVSYKVFDANTIYASAVKVA